MRREPRRSSTSGAWLLIHLLWLGGLMTLGSGCRNVSGGGEQRPPPEDPELAWERRTEPLAGVERPLEGRPPQVDAPLEEAELSHPADNTGINARDRSENARTPLDQGKDERAMHITTQIRKRVMADGDLSFTAKNIKIISGDGLVTLKGPVSSDDEHRQILAIAQRVVGDWRIEDQIDVIDKRG